MSGFGIAGVVLGSVPIIIAQLENFTSIQHEFALYIAKRRAYNKKTEQLRKEYGFAAAWLITSVFPQAMPLMEMIEKDILRGGTHRATSFMEAQTSSLSMIALAGAIIAQVAITALSLHHLNDAHWTSEAFFITSLVCGVLSVFFACVTHPSIRGLFNADQIRDWLSKPTTEEHRQLLNSSLKSAEINILLPLLPDLALARSSLRPSHTESLRDLEVLLSSHRWQVASCYAAVMLIVPSRLLTIALSNFAIGLGIYIGTMYTSNLVPEYGTGSLGILIIYIGTMLAALVAFYIPCSMKINETSLYKRFEDLVRLVDSSDGPTNTGREDTFVLVTDSLANVSTSRPESKYDIGLRPMNIQTGDGNGHKCSTTAQDSVADLQLEPVGFEAEIHAAPLSTSRHSPPVVPTDPSHFKAHSSRSRLNHLSQTRSVDFESALKDLLKAQEDSANASRKLLESFQNGIDRQH